MKIDELRERIRKWKSPMYCKHMDDCKLYKHDEDDSYHWCTSGYDERCKGRKGWLALCDEEPETCRRIVEYNPDFLWGIGNQTSELCEFAVGRRGMALEHVEEQTQRICEIAIRQFPTSIRFVREKTPELCWLAVQEAFKSHYKANDYILCHIGKKCQTEELCVEVVRKWPQLLVDVANKTYEVCLTAVRANGFAVRLVPDSLRDREMCLTAVNQNGKAIAWMSRSTTVLDKDQKIEVCRAALAQDPRSRKYVYLSFGKEIGDIAWAEYEKGITQPSMV